MGFGRISSSHEQVRREVAVGSLEYIMMYSTWTKDTSQAFRVQQHGS